MNHIVDTCPLSTFEDGLNLLHEADDDAVIWLESTATAALAKKSVSLCVEFLRNKGAETVEVALLEENSSVFFLI